MRALSLWQPHGSLLITGAKPFETRGRKTNVRGEILLHAAQRCVKWEMAQYLGDLHYQLGLQPLLGYRLNFNRVPQEEVTTAHLPFGAFIGIGTLVNCIRVEDMTQKQIEQAQGFGDFSKGRFAWEFRNVRRFRTPIPARGHQGFFFAAVDLRKNELIPVNQPLAKKEAA